MLQELGMDSKARNVLLQNDRGSYTVPSNGLYPYQELGQRFCSFGIFGIRP